ncbi:MAG: hypothetical protein POELPBGB_01311 [Bacteroidia bacterium]|nr:hypothetical protein [Bacteroidia bacterium]
MEEDFNEAELDKLIDESFNKELHNVMANKIAPYTCHFLKQEGEKVKPFASGVLAKLGGSYYILTASHVIEDWSNQNKLFLEVQPEFYVSVAGKGSGTEIHKDRKIDIAYIKLAKKMIPILKMWYQFLTISKFLHNRKSVLEANYCVFGFPSQLSKTKNGVFKSKAVGYHLKPIPDKVYRHYGFDFLSHYVLEFKGKATNIETGVREKIRTQHYGLSGGGLWYITLDFKRNKLISRAHLIGIMSEFRRDRYDCLVANRIEIILATLHHDEGLQIKQKK